MRSLRLGAALALGFAPAAATAQFAPTDIRPASAMATPIAHKGATAGAKVMARTALRQLMEPELVDPAADSDAGGNP